MHYLLFYEKAPDYAARQKPLQAAHLTYVEESVRRGDMLLGGSLADPSDGEAVMLFQADSAGVVEAFAAADPYVTHGIVSRWRVRTWETVVGPGAALRRPAAP